MTTKDEELRSAEDYQQDVLKALESYLGPATDRETQVRKTLLNRDPTHVMIEQGQFKTLTFLASALIGSANRLTDSLHRDSVALELDVKGLRTELKEGFVKVVEAISKITTPEPPPDSDAAVKGTIVARYKFDSDQDPITYSIIVKDLKSAKGRPVGAGDIDISVESSIPAIQAVLSPQTLSEDGNSVSANLTLTGVPDEMQTANLALVTVRATNRDTKNVVAADSDEFVTGPPEAAIGTIETPVPLEEVVEEPPVV